jgi:hypothetical protein
MTKDAFKFLVLLEYNLFLPAVTLRRIFFWNTSSLKVIVLVGY